ncbi:hypothetical protein [Lentilactobacillus kisonensis]|nr:hypothetical protein [Lentilactobacillus kisonensis]EHO53714.1 hypothetical protein HMPREF9104_00459 [Lentilactobacillus kisonensis F0435]
MGLLKKLFTIRGSGDAHKDGNQSVDNYSSVPYDYQFVIQTIQVYWTQYLDSLFLLRFTHNCENYFSRKDFVIPRLRMLKRAIEHVGGAYSFTDSTINVQIVIYPADIDKIIQKIESPVYDEGFIKNHCDSLDYKLSFLTAAKDKLTIIARWRHWLYPYEKRLSAEILKPFNQHCLELEEQIESTSDS